MQTYKKKLFKHGGSKAVDLPMEAFANMESDAQFHLFLEALFQDAMEHPEQLKNLEEVWDEEWEELLNFSDVLN
jgi:hypothetical protein